MVFSSIVFILYFLPLFFTVYFLSPKKWRNVIIVLGSIFFYSWGAPKFIFVILLTTLLDFFIVRKMDSSDSINVRKWLLIGSVGVNVGLLFYFKYSNFFIENIQSVLAHWGYERTEWVKLALPIGISFYTFETITYVVDVYRRVHKPLTVFTDYLLYIIFFPKLVAGPIVRYHDMADQIMDREKYETNENRLLGFYRFIIGLAKKVLIANHMGFVADQVFALPHEDWTTPTAWIGILAYTFQIYFDFSGYSDMALGLARMMGFRLPENFDNPYIARSVTEFWRRWHISLGNWMRNYLYIPLGGNRVDSKFRLYLNLWLVFLLSGFWHGASWNFLFWGAYHGFFLVIERMFLGKYLERIPNVCSVLYNFLIITIGWVFFRIESFSEATCFVSKLFSWNVKEVIYLNSEYAFYFIIAGFFSFFGIMKWAQRLQKKVLTETYSSLGYISATMLAMIFLTLCVASISSLGYNSFIYFRF
jgi:alginate O-acetyltransferase complex protein AlgI